MMNPPSEEYLDYEMVSDVQMSGFVHVDRILGLPIRQSGWVLYDSEFDNNVAKIETQKFKILSENIGLDIVADGGTNASIAVSILGPGDSMPMFRQ